MPSTKNLAGSHENVVTTSYLMLYTGLFKESHGNQKTLHIECAWCPWSHRLRPKNFMIVCRCHQFLFGFLANGRVPGQLSVRWNRRMYTHLLAFMAEANFSQETVWWRLCPVIASHRISNFQMTSGQSLWSMEPWAVPPAPVRVPSQRPLAPSFTSVMTEGKKEGFYPGS